MSYDLILLTATGGRPEAFNNCIRWMNNQDYKGLVKWIIVDDYEFDENYFHIEEPIRDDWHIERISPTPKWSPGDNTQSRNLLEGLEKVDGDSRLVIIEDDDYYSPTYLSETARRLGVYDLVGERETYYYHTQTHAYRRCNNSKHASLCSTAMKGQAIDHFREVCTKNLQYIDIELWKTFEGSKQLYKTHLVVGIKGLPGRPGIGQGHSLKPSSSVSLDKDYSALKELIGEDYKYYVKR